jgi:poly(A) polymerase
MLTGAGRQAFLVGGCVRNALLGVAVADIDIATDAEPEQVVALAKSAGLKPVPTGIEHGTVTVIADGKPHEITTFRRDVETDGRRAVVAYSGDMAEDAARRDFTMNALYADASGQVFDPLGTGLTDLAARRVRFAGDPSARITEDYLRILRFFRFHAWYGDPVAGFDTEALAAISANSGGIETLSRERVGHEMRRLLAAIDPAPALATMQASGVLHRVLAGADAKAVAPLVHLEDGGAVDWIARLVVLGGADPTEALRLSRDEARQLQVIRDEIGTATGPAELAYRHDADAARSIVLCRAALLGVPLPLDLNQSIAAGAAAQFPVRAADLLPDLHGPALGAALARIEQRWIASGFQLSREQLLP